MNRDRGERFIDATILTALWTIRITGARRSIRRCRFKLIPCLARPSHGLLDVITMREITKMVGDIFVTASLRYTILEPHRSLEKPLMSSNHV